MSDQEATDRGRMSWPTLVIIGLALFGAISLIQLVVGLVFTITRLLLVVGIVAVLVVFFRGPPDTTDR